jgi:hypothetical protein
VTRDKTYRNDHGPRCACSLRLQAVSFVVQGLPRSLARSRLPLGHLLFAVLAVRIVMILTLHAVCIDVGIDVGINVTT